MPEPITWTEPFDATVPGAAPPQTVGGLDLVPGMIPDAQTEACLTAEICTPVWIGRLAPGARLVPGGSYRVGAAALPALPRPHPAAHDVVVVGVTYRLGALGWLAAGGDPTNLGLRYFRPAVDWLRANVAAVGGDPDRIVLMGESAGSGLRRVPPRTPTRPPGRGRDPPERAPAGADARRRVGRRAFLDAAGASSADVRATPVDALLAAQDQTVADSLIKVGPMPFHPWVDGDLLARARPRAGFPAIPLVVGTTADEMELYRDQVPALPTTSPCRSSPARRPTSASPTRRVSVPRSVCRPRHGRSRRRPRAARAQRALARAHAARGNPVYRYRFTWEAPVRRACHALDLPFTFGTFDVSTWREFAGATGVRAAGPSAVAAHAGGVDASPHRRPRRPAMGAGAVVGHQRLGDDADGFHDMVAHRTAIWLGTRERRCRKVAIVTGASRGIGKGIALELGAAGATVYVTARSTSEADHPLPGTIGATA